MNFDLNEEQILLKETAQRLLADRYGFEARRRVMRQPLGWSRDVWALFAEQGFLAAPFSEAHGGLGGGPIESLILAEAFGRCLLAEPYLATVVMAGTALSLCDDAELHSALISQIASGELTASFADDEPGSASGAGAGRTVARPEGRVWALTGTKVDVLHGDSADRLVVTARIDGELGVFLVDAEAPGLSRRGYGVFDGQRAAEVTLDRVLTADRLAIGQAAEDLVERVRQHAIAYVASEAVGLMDMLLEASVEHLKARKQFGQTLSSFQALKHRCAEMLVALEQARSLAIYAALMLDEPDAAERRKAFAAVKSVIGSSGVQVGQAAVQLHGGLGVTEEHRIGWGLRRLMMIELMFGDSDRWSGELARLGGFVA